MSSQKRRDASRKNGALGGPKSPEGKKKSSQNARKHGLYALSLSTENQEAYDEYRQTFFDEWQPATPTEDLLVHELAMTSWHLRRLSATQNWLLEDEMAMQHDEVMDRYNEEVPDPVRTMLAYKGALESSQALAWLSRERGRLHRVHSRCISSLLALQQGRNPGSRQSPPPVQNDENEPKTPVNATPPRRSEAPKAESRPWQAPLTLRQPDEQVKIQKRNRNRGIPRSRFINRTNRSKSSQ